MAFRVVSVSVGIKQIFKYRMHFEKSDCSENISWGQVDCLAAPSKNRQSLCTPQLKNWLDIDTPPPTYMYIIIFKPLYVFCNLIWGILVSLSWKIVEIWAPPLMNDEIWVPPSNEWQNIMHPLKLHTPSNVFNINQPEYWLWYFIDTDTM